MEEQIIVLTTFPDADSADAAARGLVTQSLAACVNILPQMTSVYTWQGKTESGQEHQLVIKTRRSLFAQIEDFIGSQHPYELPELLVLPITGGAANYLNWMNETTHVE